MMLNTENLEQGGEIKIRGSIIRWSKVHNRESYWIRNLDFTAIGNEVFVSNGENTINTYEYKDHETACEKAYKLALQNI
jgi:hypothetical protein